MAGNRKKWYVVWRGTEPGVCDSWAECEARVKGFPDARYKSFDNQEDAIMAFRNGGEDPMALLRAIAKHSPVKHINYDAIPEIAKDSIAVDGACSGNPGLMEYRGVDVMTGAEIFHQGPYPDGTNNIGEFLALVHALAFFAQRNRPQTVIYSDSRTAMAWVRNRKCNSKLERTERNAHLFELVARAEHWLNTHTPINRIVKWDTKQWGEIPADFGRK
ncbi:MAG: ribonuclease H family protein [Muribaculaceae bacterium]|nr:ribonuclease H family protein [Muribaculaceae bacterium]